MPETDDAKSQTWNPTAVALQAKFEQGMALHRQGKLAGAERIYREVLQRQPNHFDALHLFGVIALQTRRTGQGVELITKAIEINPNVAAAHGNLGFALVALKRFEEALASYDKAIALKPDYAEAHNNRGAALVHLMRHDEALASYDRAIRLKPDYAEAYNNRGLALMNRWHPAEALASFDQAIALKPDYAEAYNNRGLALIEPRRLTEALASFERATTLKPDYAAAHWNQSLCLLRLGRFEQGWRQYEWRKRRDKPVAARSYPQPLWLGEQDIAAKTLFIWWEQGFGDTIQFCRYAKLVEARGAKVIMSVQQPLRRLLEQIGPTIKIIGPEEVPNYFDYHCPLLSLPLAFHTTLETIPAQRRYLKADEELRLAWAARLSPKTKPRIGVVWRVGTSRKNDHRSIELEKFLPILSPDSDWICLQKDIREKDLAALRQLGRIAFFGDELRDFSDTAALLDLMDLVITVDTSVAHLAGAMGKPVWILLPNNHDWRWQVDQEDSPWYPTARLFRQDETRAWDNVIARVHAALRESI